MVPQFLYINLHYGVANELLSAPSAAKPQHMSGWQPAYKSTLAPELHVAQGRRSAC